MLLNEIETNLKKLSRQEKFHAIRFLLAELSTEEEQVSSQHFNSDCQHGFHSQYDAFDAARKLQMLLKTKASK